MKRFFQIFLALKCLASLSFGIARAVETTRLVQLPSYSLYPPAWVAFISGVGAGVNSQLCWAYTLERILATAFVKTYERQRPWFGCVVGGFIVASSVFLIARDTLRYGHVLITFELIVGGFGTQTLGVVCILIVLFLRCFNTKRYRKDSEYTRAVRLTARYQNAENVRTTCQLTPLILLHLLSGFSLNSLFVAEYLDLSNGQKFLQLVVVNLTNCFLYIACQISVL
ncbi:hypothetical protein AAVH_20396 [Aphelenchoides avenae]|nr:hypothetical protein AAVH_20396 [Aphelenchus avenae]